jgi:hypothetical protein
MIGNIGTFNDDFIADHDRRGYREIKGEVLIGFVFGLGFGGDFDFDRVLRAQPGHEFFEMFSRFAVGFVEKKVDFQHRYLLIAI